MNKCRIESSACRLQSKNPNSKEVRDYKSRTTGFCKSMFSFIRKAIDLVYIYLTAEIKLCKKTIY